MVEVGSVPLHLHYKEEELSQSSRLPSCASTSMSTLSPSRSETSSTKQELDQSKRSVGQKVDHAILNLAPAFFSLNMVGRLVCFDDLLTCRVPASPRSCYTIYPTMPHGYKGSVSLFLSSTL